jgi:hypothetical protein
MVVEMRTYKPMIDRYDVVLVDDPSHLIHW